MTRTEKATKVEGLKREANTPKSDLMRLEQLLLNIGATKEAEQLGRIIGRLEDWQNRGQR